MRIAPGELTIPSCPAGVVLRSAADGVTILGEGLMDCATEKLRLAFLDSEARLVRLIEQPGDARWIALSLGRIVRDVIRYEARGLLLAHNHPSGDPTPSDADRRATRSLAELLRAIEAPLIDHLIFARGGVTSFRGLGLL